VFLFFPIAITSNWVPSGKEADVRLIGTLWKGGGEGNPSSSEESGRSNKK
jgi:hypothetical protein